MFPVVSRRKIEYDYIPFLDDCDCGSSDCNCSEEMGQECIKYDKKGKCTKYASAPKKNPPKQKQKSTKPSKFNPTRGTGGIKPPPTRPVWQANGGEVSTTVTPLQGSIPTRGIENMPKRNYGDLIGPPPQAIDTSPKFTRQSQTTTPKQGWLTKLLDYGLSKDQIKANVEIVKAQAQSQGQVITNEQAYQQVAQMNNVPVNAGGSVGGQTGFAVDSALDWVKENFLVVAAGLGAVYLLFRQPPGQSKRS